MDAGANIYVGHGDPRLQGIEIYRGCVILYCLGNFFFQTKTEVGFYGHEVWESVIVQVHCHKHGDEEEDGESSGKTRRHRRRRGGKGEGSGDDSELKHGPDGEAERDEEERESKEMESGAESVSSYSIKLIPIALNEVGDGFDHGHEHLVTGNVVQEKQKQEDAEIVARSRPASPTPQLTPLPLSPLVLPSASSPSTPASLSPMPLPPTSSSFYNAIPAFLSPPSFSLNSPPRPIAHSLSSTPPTFSTSPRPSFTPASTTPPSTFVPPLSPSPHTISSTYALHLSTRGLPRVADREQAVAILRKIQKMSEEWGTVIDIDEGDGEGEAGGVVGWVSTVREEELQHPFLRPRSKEEIISHHPPPAKEAVTVSSD